VWRQKQGSKGTEFRVIMSKTLNLSYMGQDESRCTNFEPVTRECQLFSCYDVPTN